MLRFLALAVPFALADRLAGGPYCKAIANWVQWVILKWPAWLQVPIMAVARMRAVAWATLWLAAVLAWEARVFGLGYDLAFYAVGFAAWRWDGWTATGSGIDPKTLEEVEGLALRHCFAFTFFVIFLFQNLIWRRDLSMTIGLCSLSAFVCSATLLGMLLTAFEQRGRDVNAYVELARGLCLGTALAATRLAVA